MSKAIAGLRAFFNFDYTLTQAYMRHSALLGAVGYIIFHFIDASMGYRDSVPLRTICCLLPLPILAFPRTGGLGWSRILYWEFTVGFMLPLTQTYLFFLNSPDAYWLSSIMLAGLCVGLLTRPAWFIPQMVIGAGAGLGLYTLVEGAPGSMAIQVFLSLQFNVALMGLLALVTQSGLQTFHRRGLLLADANALAHAARKREEETRATNDELRRRETVITRFVRQSLFDELVTGRDPTDFEPVEKNLGVLFCDIREFTQLTEVLVPREKQTFLNLYFSMMTHPIVENGGEVDKIMGDCVMGIFPDGRTAALAAVDMRLQLQDFNRRMFLEGKSKIRNGIGIAKGPVLLGNFGSYEKLDRTVIGEAVNIASRLESKTKMYNLEVVVTEDVIKDLDPDEAHWRWIDVVQVKGSSRHLKIYEVYSHQPLEVRRYKDATRGMLEKALNIYFQKGFKDALCMFNSMREEVPPHRHGNGDLMDHILDYYIERCQAWAKEDQGTWERMQKWQGVHIFHEK